MQCPYCGQVNAESTRYCLRCGRAMPSESSSASVRVTPLEADRSAAGKRWGEAARPPRQTSGAGLASGGQQTVASERRPQQTVPREVVAAPEPPAPFPPRTLSQLQALLPGALEYTVGAEEVRSNRRKVIEIVYPPCTAWQQAATLYKALSERDDRRYETVVVRGFQEQSGPHFLFNNGQLTFDRNARLGGRLIKRYLIETHRGFEMEAVRVVLTEEVDEQA
jgi:hypothetical protein